ncbi:glycoside hydrolase family 73 protein [Silvimonas soli]|uniref:glycoside hydrolase family 73 protein n=1 Tax=Silvimonas soli TaxID=2980100 RepID=UPI0024B3487B|nr:glucosaminidase domain-containing protein [Silvimonas soli]
MTPQVFIAAISAAAVASAKKTGIPASFTIAESALESGWGASQLAQQAMNLFGVKADPAWHGPTFSLQTREYLKSQWVMVPALWRKYDDWQGCMDDHAQFLLTNPRYKNCFPATGGVAFAQQVAASGYATDPDYAAKIRSIISTHELAKFDS